MALRESSLQIIKKTIDGNTRIIECEEVTQSFKSQRLLTSDSISGSHRSGCVYTRTTRFFLFANLKSKNNIYFRNPIEWIWRQTRSDSGFRISPNLVSRECETIFKNERNFLSDSASRIMWDLSVLHPQHIHTLRLSCKFLTRPQAPLLSFPFCPHLTCLSPFMLHLRYVYGINKSVFIYISIVFTKYNR